MAKKKYEVEVCRTSYSYLTFGVEADSEKEARSKALDKAYNTSWDEDDAEYEIESCEVSSLSEEEWKEEYS